MWRCSSALGIGTERRSAIRGQYRFRWGRVPERPGDAVRPGVDRLPIAEVALDQQLAPGRHRPDDPVSAAQLAAIESTEEHPLIAGAEGRGQLAELDRKSVV